VSERTRGESGERRKLAAGLGVEDVAWLLVWVTLVNPSFRSLSLRRPFVLLLAAFFAISCLGGRPPQVAPSRTLELSDEGAASQAKKEFAVVFAGPKGEAPAGAVASVVFNRPMRALELAGDERVVPIQIRTKDGTTPKGEWRWLGTSAAMFAPQAALPRATEFVVTIPAGTKALDGSALAKEVAYTFSTERPRLVRSVPYDGATGLSPKQTFELFFNQPVTLKSLETALKMVAKDEGNPKAAARPIAFTVAYAKSDVLTHVKVVPTQPLPLDAKIEISHDRTLRGTEGTLPPDNSQSVAVHTYEPLTVQSISCSREDDKSPCRPGGGIHVQLSNAVHAKDFRAHVKLDPPRAIRWSRDSGDEQSSWFSIPVPLKAASSVRVTIARGLVDEFKQTMKQDASVSLQVGDEPPSVRIGLRGSAFESSAKAREIPIVAMNQPSFDLVASPIDEPTTSRLLSKYGAERWAVASANGKVQTVSPTVPKNTEYLKKVPLDAAYDAKPGRGAFVLGTNVPSLRGRSPQFDVRVLSVSDLAISAKLSRFGSVVWVTKLSDGKPVAGAQVSVRNGAGVEVAKGVADAEGICIFSKEQLIPFTEHGQSEDHLVLFARSGADWTFRAADEIVEPWRINAYADASGGLRTYGMLFTDRGIYRKGETVRLKGIFRTPLPQGTQTPKGKVVEVRASDTEGTEIFDEKATLGAFGDFSLDVPLPESIHLGRMSVSASVEDEKPKEGRWAPVAAHAEVEIAAYRPTEFKVAVEPGRASYIRGENAEYTARGDYLFGAPMGGAKGRVTITRAKTYFTPEKLGNFQIDDETYASDIAANRPNATNLDTHAFNLDPKGAYAGSVPLKMPDQTGAETLTIESEIEDLSRQTVAAQSSLIVHPGEFYVGVRTAGEMFVEPTKALNVEAIAIEPNGGRRRGVKIGVDLVRRTWNTTIESSAIEGDENGGRYSSRPNDKVVGHCDIVSEAAPASCAIVPKEAGYYIVRATAKDPRGNVLASSVPIYATGAGASFGWADNDSSKLDLTADKKAYEVGDSAKILIKSPFKEADALVTVERTGVYRRERIHVSGSMATVNVKITDDLRPNAYVSVELIKGRSAPSPEKGVDVGAPEFRIGYANLSVNPEARRLHVALSSNKVDYRPGEEVNCDIRVTDRSGVGVASGVTFYAVDEGVLMLTAYKTPDPIPVFTRNRPLAVFSLESRTDLARLLKISASVDEDKGGEGGGGGEGLNTRQDFRATAHFEPNVVTGKDGKAHVHFKLPDNLTTFRLMAVAAAEDDRFGFSESRIVTSRPLMARPALPRFLRAGDSFEASMIVSAKGLKAKEVEAQIDVAGAKLLAPQMRNVTLPASGSVEVRWPVAVESPGRVTFTFRAKGGGAGDEVKIVRDASVPISPEAVAFYGETTGTVAEQFGSLAAVRPDYGGLDVRLSSTALVGLDDGVESLVQYPYGCTEQITSRLVPLVAIVDLAKEYGIKLPENSRAMAQKALEDIRERQHGNGGFGYWPSSSTADLWVSAYALWGLTLGKSAGYDVPDDALNLATAYLRRELAARLKAERPLDLASAAFIVDVLAMRGAPDAGYMGKLFEKRAKLPLFARALLAHAMAISKTMPSEAKELLNDVDNHLRVTPTGASVTSNHGDEYVSILDSDARSTAMVLRAILAVDEQHPLASRLVKGLLSLRKGGSWRSTQETAWALVAINDFRQAREKTAPNFDAKVFFGENAIFDTEFRSKSVTAKSASFAMPKLFANEVSRSAFQFEVSGTGTLFYEARLRYARKTLPKESLDRGFFVQKYVRSFDRGELNEAVKSMPTSTTTAAKPGDLVLVDLVVVNSDPREHVVVDDPLPAGLEAVQSGLATESASLAVDHPDDSPDDDDYEEPRSRQDEAANGRGFSYAWFHREYHDDRVLTFVEHMPAGIYHYRYVARATSLGSFIVPPTRVECMYEPEVFGRTGASKLEIK